MSDSHHQRHIRGLYIALSYSYTTYSDHIAREWRVKDNRIYFESNPIAASEGELGIGSGSRLTDTP